MSDYQERLKERRAKRRIDSPEPQEQVSNSGPPVMTGPILFFAIVSVGFVFAAIAGIYFVLKPAGENASDSGSSALATVSQKQTEALDEKFKKTVGLIYPIIRITGGNRDVEITLSGTLGSGFLVSKNGYVLTNHHVISPHREELVVESEIEEELQREVKNPDLRVKALVLVFLDGKQYDAELVRGVFDTEMDYALLKIVGAEEHGDFPFLEIHPNATTDKPMIGRLESVLALGYPGASLIEFEKDSLEAYSKQSKRDKATLIKDQLPAIYFEYNLTRGVVSRVTQEGPRGSEVVMHDATISPGNSGGPLVDLDGRVIGVNTWVASKGGISLSGYGSAVSIRSVLPHISRHIK